MLPYISARLAVLSLSLLPEIKPLSASVKEGEEEGARERAREENQWEE